MKEPATLHIGTLTLLEHDLNPWHPDERRIFADNHPGLLVGTQFMGGFWIRKEDQSGDALFDVMGAKGLVVYGNMEIDVILTEAREREVEGVKAYTAYVVSTGTPRARADQPIISHLDPGI